METNLIAFPKERYSLSSRFLTQRPPTLLVDYPGLKVELVVSDQFGDMIEDRLELAMRVGVVTDAPWWCADRGRFRLFHASGGFLRSLAPHLHYHMRVPVTHYCLARSRR